MDPYKLILEFFSNNKQDEFKKMSLFEAGFGDLGCLLDLYYELPFHIYHGIEKYEESRLSVTHDDELGSRSSGTYSSSDSTYLRYLNYVESTKVKNTLHENEFDSTFKLEFEKNIEHYFLNNSNCNHNYGIGIFSNLFHKFPDKQLPQNIVNWFYSNSSPDSYLLFTVMTSDLYALNGIDFIYNESDIKELLKQFPGIIISQSSFDSFDTYLVKKKHIIKQTASPLKISDEVRLSHH